MQTAITLRLPKDVAGKVSRLAKKRGLSKVALLRDLVERESIRREFKELHAEGVRRARAKGIVSEEQISEIVS